MPGPGAALVERAASRLKFPQAFAIFLALFLVDLLVPDFIPFIDELLLGLGAVVFGLWREKREARETPKPPMKNVTPAD